MEISVVVPAYNSENFIAETLDCLLNQTLKDIQIIVVNDGSTDGTGAIIDSYAAKHANILPIYQENSGVSAARNNGIEHAEGKYIMFLDSDDLLSRDALEKIRDALERNQADIAICRIERFGYGGRETNPIVDSLAKESVIDCFDKRLIRNYLVGNKCYRTDMIKGGKVRFPALRYSEDGAFFMQVLFAARPRITGVYGAVMKYRTHSPKEGLSVTQRISLDLVKDFSASMDMIYCAALSSIDGYCKDPADYLQELLLKSCFAMINEFYRMAWSADDETLAFIGRKYGEWQSKMTEDSLKKCREAVKDIGEPVFSKKEIANAPFISIISKSPSDEFVKSLYAQSMPYFELITSDSKVERRENVVFLPEKGFKKAARSAAKGKLVISLGGKKPLDRRFLKIASLLKRSPKFGIFPDFLIKFGALLLPEIKSLLSK